eukprot:641636-Pelagomonas_calceolata.AAC.5
MAWPCRLTSKTCTHLWMTQERAYGMLHALAWSYGGRCQGKGSVRFRQGKQLFRPHWIPMHWPDPSNLAS